MSYGYPAALDPAAAADVALAWLGLPHDHALRVDVEVLIAEGNGWCAIKRHALLHGTESVGGEMSVKITVRNFRGLKVAEVEANPLILAAGSNAQGKSSLAQGIAACLTGRAIEDSFELRKSDVKSLVRDGTLIATVDIVTDKGSAKMIYPDAKLQTTGDAPWASLFAAGLASIPTMPAKERAAALAPYMKAQPDLADLKGALAEEFDEDTIGKCWEAIKRDGWDAVLKSVEDRRARSRAIWEQIAGESFGSAKAKIWRPEGWADDLFEEASVEDLTANRDEAQAAVDRAVGAAAVEISDVGKLCEVAEDGAARLQALDEAKNAVETVKREKERADEQFFRMPLPENFAPLECPHCQGKIRLRSDPARPQGYGCTLEKAEPLSKDENDKRRMNVAEIEGRRSNVAGRLVAAQRALMVAEERHAESVAAREKVEAAGSRDDGAAATEAEARRQLQVAETDLIRFKRKVEAEEAFARWEANEKFAVVLSAGPQGLRAKKLAEATLLFNSQVLLPLCKTVAWGSVEITEDFRVTLDGRIFTLLSDSDQMRVKIVLQVAMAKIDGSAMVVIDRAEALDAANKKKLMGLLIDQQIPALVCMVVAGPSAVPDLAKAGVGSTIWISDGTATPLAAVA